MGTELLDVSSLTVRYGQSTALRDISLAIAEGESVFVVGPNGAGKTTLLRAVSGLEKCAAGTISYRSKPITGMKIWDIVKLGIAHVPQNRRCFGPLSVQENLEMGAYTRDKSEVAESLEAVYDIFPVLKEKRKQSAAELSGGQQQMVAVGRAIMTSGSLIMLDEPSLGLAPMLVEQLGENLRRIRDQFNVAILIVEQNINLALSVGDRGYVLRSGRVIAQGSPDDLRGQLRDAYLGEAPDKTRTQPSPS
jgi:branched-chain amino acid transport system ATP-binding protein